MFKSRDIDRRRETVMETSPQSAAVDAARAAEVDERGRNQIAILGRWVRHLTEARANLLAKVAGLERENARLKASVAALRRRALVGFFANAFEENGGAATGAEEPRNRLLRLIEDAPRNRRGRRGVRAGGVG
jgi:hypothetical protein